MSILHCLSHLAHDLANPQSCWMMPALIPSLKFNRILNTLNEVNEADNFLPCTTPVAFGLTLDKLQYNPLPFSGRYDNKLVVQVIGMCQILAKFMAEQAIQELGIELAGFHTACPSSIFHYDTLDYAKTVPCDALAYTLACTNSRICAPSRTLSFN